jgi:hypothetical protein
MAITSAGSSFQRSSKKLKSEFCFEFTAQFSFSFLAGRYLKKGYE